VLCVIRLEASLATENIFNAMLRAYRTREWLQNRIRTPRRSAGGGSRSNSGHDVQGVFDFVLCERNLPAQFSVCCDTTKDDGERTNSLAAFTIVPVGVDPRSRT
jgi:hypothetical protein